MQKHHWYVLIGSLLMLFLPLYAPLHGAGIGVTIAGVIDWIWSRSGN